MNTINRLFSVAPMMDLTDRHDRYLLRLLSTECLLYTEMVTAEALINGDPQWLLKYNQEEHPVALQLGGSDPKKLAYCCELAQMAGYDEVNLNVGCPSDRVQSGRFGACLMLEPDLVAECFVSMSKACDIPITIKCRIGVDDQHAEKQLPAFITTIAEAGCRVFVVHARKAWLQGLSPKENREVPPLDYPLVYAMKKQFPQLEFVINGGINNIDEAKQHLQEVDGVMLGRAAYYEPWLLANVDQLLYGKTKPSRSREQVFLSYLAYMKKEAEQGTELKHMARHVLSLFHGLPGARLFRRHISENIYQQGASLSIIEDAYTLMQNIQTQ